MAPQLDSGPQSFDFGPNTLWEVVRPGLVARDPNANGDEAVFCSDYGAGNDVPDLVLYNY